MNNGDRRATEDKVRRKLQERFGALQREVDLRLLGGKTHRFDLVSTDRKVVVEIKTSRPNKEGKLRPALRGDICRDCLVLLGCRGAKNRILMLTNRTVYDEFLKTQYAGVARAKGIQILPFPSRELEAANMVQRPHRVNGHSSAK